MYIKKEYAQSDAVTQAQQALESQLLSKPGGYVSQYDSLLHEALGKLQNRKPFQYDLSSDALYRNYRDQYVRQGKQAMEDTLGRASALTGGYGNSYAQTAGQQTYQSYLQKLSDRVPELYALALEKYQLEGDDLLKRYTLLAQQEEQDYSRYQDLLSQWNRDHDALYSQWLEERSFDYGAYQDQLAFDYDRYRDQVKDQQWQSDFDYRRQQNEIAYQQWLQQFEYQKSQDALAYQQWLQEFQEDQRRYEAQLAAAAAKTNRGGGASSAKSKETDEDVLKAQTFVENMLNGGISSKFDPERIVNTTNVLTENQRKEAQKYLQTVLAAGRMK